MAAPDSNSATDFSKLNKLQKFAALLIMLGPDSAAQIMKNLDEHELDAVTGEMAKITMVSQELQVEILHEFAEVAIQASTGIRGGVDFAQTALEKALGLFKASNIISRVSPSRAPVAAIAQIADLESRQIFNLIKHEQPQTIALILSYLTPGKASEVLGMLRSELRELVIERLATLAPTPIEVVERVVEVLNHKLGGKHTRALNQTGGVKNAANVLNAMDKNVSKSLLMSLEERNPELGKAIRQKMFTFDEVGTLEATALQRLLREVDMTDLAIALKTASESLQSKLLGCISKRAAESIREEISFMGPLKLRDIEAAQLRIIEVVRRLESEGEIDLDDAKESSTNEVMV